MKSIKSKLNILKKYCNKIENMFKSLNLNGKQDSIKNLK